MNRTITSVMIEKTNNGYLVTENYKTSMDAKEWDYEDEKFIYTTIDEALAKVKELIA